VPPDEIPGLFEPFHRLAATERPIGPAGDYGAGLGPSIVRSVAHAHGGHAQAARPDGGLTVTVHLPAAINDVATETAPTRSSIDG
jgi:signal transduction histidine kinase